MAQIKSNVKDRKCSFCNKYLSYGPVHLLPNGKNLCARCPKPMGINPARNRSYESLAENQIFPCQYEGKGCQVKVKFSKMKLHEFVCDFRPFKCPILEQCEWSGLANQFADHCKQGHPENVLFANPATLEHDITKSNSRKFLMLAYEVWFLIYTKICVQSGNIYHSVQQLVGSLIEPPTFDLIISNANGELRRIGNVLLSKNAFVLENHAIIVDINCLIKILKRIKDTTFQIHINNNNKPTTPFHQLIRPVTNPCFLVEDYCISRPSRRPFFTDQQNCQFSCYYKSTYYDLLKHETYHCRFCYICCSPLYTDISNHFKTKHFDIINQNMILTKNNKIDYLCSFVPSLVHFNYLMTDSVFTLRVYAAIRKSKLLDYKFQVIFFGPENETFEKELSLINDKFVDWAITVNIENANISQIKISLNERNKEQDSISTSSDSES